MADVFISYSQRDAQVAADLATFLAQCGYEVWWDYEMVGGASIRDVIKKELAKSRAAIVIWSPNSSESGWVIDEAEDAKRTDKLIPSRVKELNPADIPFGFRGMHTPLVSAPDEILKALDKLGVKPSRPPAPPETKTVSIGGQIDPESIAKAEQFAHWEFIKASDDPLAFRSYAERFPTSSFVMLAKSRLDSFAKAAWQPLILSEDIVALEHFVATFPDEEHSKPAKLKLQGLKNRDEEEKSWQRIKDSNQLTEVEDHVNRFGGGFTAARAFEKLRELRRARDARDRWNSIGPSTDIELFEQFIRTYGETEYAALARKRIEDIHHAREERDWNAARNERHPAPFLRFLKDHPSGARANEALALLEAMPRVIEEEAWGVVKDSNEPLLHRAFAAALPHSRYTNTLLGPMRHVSDIPAPPPIPEQRPWPGWLTRWRFWLAIVAITVAIAFTMIAMVANMRVYDETDVAISVGAALALLIASALRWFAPRLYPSLHEGGYRRVILLHSIGCLVILGWILVVEQVAANSGIMRYSYVQSNFETVFLLMAGSFALVHLLWVWLGRFEWSRYAAYLLGAVIGACAILDAMSFMSGITVLGYRVTTNLSFYGGIALIAFNVIAILVDRRSRHPPA
jgi:hypothetical protein